MGALAGSVTASEFYVRGELPKDFREFYLQQLTKRRFKEIDVNSDEDESMGWVTTHDPFSSEFTLNDVLWGDYLLVTLRHDSLKVPAAAFKLYLQKEIAAALKESGKERISKTEEEELRDSLHKKLRRRVLPSIKTYDVVWNVERNLMWLFTTNKRVTEVFQELWGDTFELPIAAKNPFSLMERLNDDKLLDASIAIEPANLAVSSQTQD